MHRELNLRVIAKLIVRNLKSEIANRKGFDELFDEIDENTMIEMETSCENIVYKIMAERT